VLPGVVGWVSVGWVLVGCVSVGWVSVGLGVRGLGVGRLRIGVCGALALARRELEEVVEALAQRVAHLGVDVARYALQV